VPCRTLGSDNGLSVFAPSSVYLHPPFQGHI
jgi:hypothetical protein